uniref:Uncharacterized protein n=1 Tax=Lygus hesperus TaxID=30085 RepID=A0A0A9W2M3_LYGHE
MLLICTRFHVQVVENCVTVVSSFLASLLERECVASQSYAALASQSHHLHTSTYGSLHSNDYVSISINSAATSASSCALIAGGWSQPHSAPGADVLAAAATADSSPSTVLVHVDTDSTSSAALVDIHPNSLPSTVDLVPCTVLAGAHVVASTAAFTGHGCPPLDTTVQPVSWGGNVLPAPSGSGLGDGVPVTLPDSELGNNVLATLPDSELDDSVPAALPDSELEGATPVVPLTSELEDTAPVTALDSELEGSASAALLSSGWDCSAQVHPSLHSNLPSSKSTHMCVTLGVGEKSADGACAGVGEAILLTNVYTISNDCVNHSDADSATDVVHTATNGTCDTVVHVEGIPANSCVSTGTNVMVHTGTNGTCDTVVHVDGIPANSYISTSTHPTVYFSLISESSTATASTVTTASPVATVCADFTLPYIKSGTH